MVTSTTLAHGIIHIFLQGELSVLERMSIFKPDMKSQRGGHRSKAGLEHEDFLFFLNYLLRVPLSRLKTLCGARVLVNTIKLLKFLTNC